MAAKKKARAKETLLSSIVDRFDGTIVEHPIAVANKALLAGLGLVKQYQADLQGKYDDLAKDGETVRDQVEDSIGSLQSRVVGQLKSKRNQVEKSVTSAFGAILDYAPVAKTSDIEKLNHKLDKVLSQVAR
jgi:polyhydroxyalkanoate synthesis regulator phasin